MTRIDLARASDLGSGIPTGTAFPGSPDEDDLFHHQTYDMLFFYDGTRWLTMDLYRDPFHLSVAQPATMGQSLGRLVPWHTDFDMWLVTFYSTTFVATTNNGSNFWTVALQKAAVNDAKTSIVSFNTSADTASNWVTRATAVGALLTPATYKEMDVQSTETGAAGSLFYSFALSYRLVGT